MNIKRITKLQMTASLAALLVAVPVFAAPAQFATLFSDHMVLKSGQPIRVWGTADAGARLEVNLNGRKARATADDDGAWSAELPKMAAGGPHLLALSEEGQETQTIEDIMVGEVWLCSGQSNMEYAIASLNEPWRDTANPPANIRLLTVPKDHSTAPRAAFGKLNGWHVATPETVPPFSAACYLFARDLQQDMNVPFGLINSSWGGSAIEAWVGADGLRELGGFTRRLDLVRLYGEDSDRAVQAFATDWQQWWHDATGNPGPWSEGFDDSEWPEAPSSMGNWQLWRGAGLESFTGMLWYRKQFELTAEQAAAAEVLQLGAADELDITWLNGQAVGTAFGWGDVRRYDVPAGVLRAGINQITVNVYNSWGAGGLNGPPESMQLELEGGGSVPLGQGWRYQVADTELGTPPMAPWESITGLTGLHNAMIAPLHNLGLSGMLWYQGESNADRADQYQGLLAAMTADRREQFHNDSLPMIVIQLPNFGGLPEGIEESGWAHLRDAQQRAAVADEHTGVVITVDSADRTDLHPPNKRIVGQRAADVARGMILGEDLLVDGIVPLAATRSGNDVVVRFDNGGQALRVAGSAQPAAFELCNAAGGCTYVSATVDGEQVIIDASGRGSAVEVRYAWANAPLINLFGKNGLPVSSFLLPIGD